MSENHEHTAIVKFVDARIFIRAHGRRQVQQSGVDNTECGVRKGVPSPFLVGSAKMVKFIRNEGKTNKLLNNSVQVVHKLIYLPL